MLFYPVEIYEPLVLCIVKKANLSHVKTILLESWSMQIHMISYFSQRNYISVHFTEYQIFWKHTFAQNRQIKMLSAELLDYCVVFVFIANKEAPLSGMLSSMIYINASVAYFFLTHQISAARRRECVRRFFFIKRFTVCGYDVNAAFIWTTENTNILTCRKINQNVSQWQKHSLGFADWVRTWKIRGKYF